MCKIITVRYVSPDGRRLSSTERKELCYRSDGTNPCLNHKYEEMTELVSSGTPSLIYDDISPASASIPSTPLTATANYDIRAPTPGESSSKRRTQYVPFLDLSRSKSKKKSSDPSSPRHRHKYRQRSDRSCSSSSNGDADSIVAIEDHGMVEPLTPSRDSRFGSISMRHVRRPPPLINQPTPPSPTSNLRVPTPGAPFHRRTYTAPESVRFQVDTEVTDRANAREQLRRENRERDRRDDDDLRRQRLRQEADDNKQAEEQARKEREEQAKDAYSRLEWERLQEKDRKRKEKQDARLEEKSKVTAFEIEQLEKEIKEMRLQAEARDRSKDEAVRKEAVSRREAQREADETRRREQEETQRKADAHRQAQKLKDQERLIERRLEDDLARIRAERQSNNARQMQEVQNQMDALELELGKQQQNRQARERAEQIEQEIRHHDVLAEEIREMEAERELDLRAEAVLRAHLEPPAYDYQQHAYDHQQHAYNHQQHAYDHQQQYITAAAPSRTSTTVLQRTSPYQSERFRRLDGERVLEEERNRASARALGPTFQNAVGLGRRNTVGGRDRDREKNYHLLRRYYPE